MAEEQADQINKKAEPTGQKTQATNEKQEQKQDQKQATKKESKKDAKNQTAKLTEQIGQLQKQFDEAQDKYLRAEAEIQNMTARFKKEQAQLMKYDGQSLAKAILPVMDNLKRALAIEVDDESGEQLKKGIQMVHDHLEEALTANSVIEIDALGQKFDPTLHQAVQSVAVQGDQKPDTVVQVLQAGYQLKDRVLRPAMVVVAQ